jgi:hypothetical protein
MTTMTRPSPRLGVESRRLSKSGRVRAAQAKGVSKTEVDKIVLRHRETLVAELVAAMRSG